MTMLAIATDETKPELAEGDQLLSQALHEIGFQHAPTVWDDKRVSWKQFQAVLIRTTWDYCEKYQNYLSWLKALEKQSIPTINPQSTIYWNLDKKYLSELENKKVDIVPTEFILKNKNDLQKIQNKFQKSERLIVKPSISASSDHTYRITNDLIELGLIIKKVEKDKPAGSQILIQPYIEEIENEGEISLIYFNQNPKPYFSHAVLKTPKKGDFRVQKSFGGNNEKFKPTQSQIKAGLKVLSALPHPWVFARVDLVNWNKKPLLGEIELVEPELFFNYEPDSAKVFAEILVELLK